MIHILLFFIIKLIIICQLLNHVPLGDKGCRNENNSSNSISINNKDMVTHPSQGSCFEQSIQGYVEAFHGHHGPKRNQILVQEDPFCHTSLLQISHKAKQSLIFPCGQILTTRQAVEP